MDLQGNIHVGCCKNTRKASCKAQAVRRSSDLPVVIAGFRSSPVLAWSRLSARNPMFTGILEHTICNSVDPLDRALYLCYFIIENKTLLVHWLYSRAQSLLQSLPIHLHRRRPSHQRSLVKVLCFT